MDNRVKIDPADLRANPYSVWNGFVSLISSDYSDLKQAQRPAHLVFWYESEVQNGGHLQYFMNRGIERARETIEALHSLGALPQAELLERATSLWTSKTRTRSSDTDDYVDVALEGEFNDVDSAFYRENVTLIAALEAHLERNEVLFINRD